MECIQTEEVAGSIPASPTIFFNHVSFLDIQLFSLNAEIPEERFFWSLEKELVQEARRFMVGSRRIELRTRGFSGLCSTD